MSMITRRAVLSTAALTGAAALAYKGDSYLTPDRSGTGGARGFPNFELQSHDGRTLRFYDDLVKGRIIVANFMYADCQGICPPMTANLQKVQALLGDRVGRDVHMYSFTLRPQRDTPAALRQYVQMHGIRRGWSFFTGVPAEMGELRRALGFVDSDPDADSDLSTHVGMVLVGNEAIDRWVSCPALGRPEAIARLVGWMGPASV
jgi:protein SCO1/2